MKETVAHLVEDSWSDELLGLLVDEAERALLTVEARADEPGRRVLTGDVPDREVRDTPEDVSELRLAIAELADAFPGMSADLETIGDRMRNVGIKAGGVEIESQPHVLDLVRLSLEVLFRLYPSSDTYETEQRLLYGTFTEENQTPAEAYAAYERLRKVLRSRLS